MTQRWAFFPNLDADVELGTTGPYQPRKETLTALARQTPVLGGLAQDAPLLDRVSPAHFDGTLADVAVCWCPTNHARATLERAGWPMPKAPAHDVLRRVNDRRFLASHGPNVIGRTFVDNAADLSRLDSSRLRLKRRFGFAGRGQRVLDGVLSADDLRWVEDSLTDGFSVEPEFDLARELSLHGYIDDAGLLLGEPCEFVCNRFGSVTHFTRATNSKYEAELRGAATEIASALRSAGYFGPFGIDAFVANSSQGESFNPLSDLNARFTLAWSVGMGPLRDVAIERLLDA